jgi:hypothetical protein
MKRDLKRARWCLKIWRGNPKEAIQCMYKDEVVKITKIDLNLLEQLTKEKRK